MRRPSVLPELELEPEPEPEPELELVECITLGHITANIRAPKTQDCKEAVREDERAEERKEEVGSASPKRAPQAQPLCSTEQRHLPCRCDY